VDLQRILPEILASRALQRFLDLLPAVNKITNFPQTPYSCGFTAISILIKKIEKILLQLKTVYICCSKKIQKT